MPVSLGSKGEFVIFEADRKITAPKSKQRPKVLTSHFFPKNCYCGNISAWRNISDLEPLFFLIGKCKIFILFSEQFFDLCGGEGQGLSLIHILEDGTEKIVLSSELKKGDIVMVSAGEIIPGDGEVIEGIASVDESAITGESAPVVRLSLIHI